jgi:sigma-E factor negative regulatory protein RseC
MVAPEDTLLDPPSGRSIVEGFARVVSLEGENVWLEPEQTTSCGPCASASACGAKSDQLGFLEKRRFTLPNECELTVGERVVVGIAENTLVRASLTAYALPLATTLGCAVAAHLTTGSDGFSVLAALFGLGVGLLLAYVRAGRLSARGELTPRFLRRARFNEGPGGDMCATD